MKQRLGIAAALLPDPELLILDEPTNGLDPAGIREVHVLMRSLAGGGLTIIVSSHRLEEIQTVCDHLVIINDGRIRFQGPIDELLTIHTGELVAVPEFPADLSRVAGFAHAAGYTARIDAGQVRIAAPSDWAPRLNAAATGAGINLAGLWTAQRTLADAFFTLTDEASEPASADAARAAVVALPASDPREHRVGGGRVPGVFVSELMKLRRPALLLGGGAVLLGFIALVTVLGLERVTSGSLGQFLRPIVLAELSQPGGLVLGLKRGGPLMGIVVLGIFAAAFGAEYSTGMLRNLLVREPRRLEFLAGKYLALLLFGAAVVLAAAIVSIGVAFAIAPSRGIATGAWTSEAGIAAVWSAIWHLIIAALGFGTLGAALAVILRSPVAALAVGVAWVLPGRGDPRRRVGRRPVLAARSAPAEPGGRGQRVRPDRPDAHHPCRVLGDRRRRHVSALRAPGCRHLGVPEPRRPARRRAARPPTGRRRRRRPIDLGHPLGVMAQRPAAIDAPAQHPGHRRACVRVDERHVQVADDEDHQQPHDVVMHVDGAREAVGGVALPVPEQEPGDVADDHQARHDRGVELLTRVEPALRRGRRADGDAPRDLGEPPPVISVEALQIADGAADNPRAGERDDEHAGRQADRGVDMPGLGHRSRDDALERGDRHQQARAQEHGKRGRQQPVHEALGEREARDARAGLSRSHWTCPPRRRRRSPAAPSSRAAGRR